MKLTKPLIVFDLETTHKETSKARIVEIACIKLFPDGTREEKEYKVNPTIPIPPEATAIHGITDNDVSKSPNFKELSKSMFDYFDGCDIGGFNSDNYDVPVMIEEFKRCGIDFPDPDTSFVDVIKLERLYNGHNLSDTYERHSGNKLDGAHGAMADTAATMFILNSILEKHHDQDISPAEIDDMLQGENKRVDIAGKLRMNEEGNLYWTFGKNKDQEILSDIGFFNWVLNNDFPTNTKEIMRAYQKKKYARNS